MSKQEVMTHTHSRDALIMPLGSKLDRNGWMKAFMQLRIMLMILLGKISNTVLNYSKKIPGISSLVHAENDSKII